LGNDAVGVGPGRGKSKETRLCEDGTLIDEFGFVCKGTEFYDEIIKRPLEEAETADDVLNYPLPEALDTWRWRKAEQMIAKYSSSYAIIGDLEATIFELSWNLVGMEKFLIDLVMKKEYVFTLLDRIQEDYAFPCGKKLVDMGVDVLWIGDDFGTQRGMLISPDFWRKHFKPRYASLISRWKKLNPELKIAYHSCGSIFPIIPDLVEVGVDILNPIQPKAFGMDLARIKRDWYGILCLFGGVDEQEILPFGTPQDVKQEVWKRFQQAGKGGGYIIAPSHNIQPDTPLENVLAYFDAVKSCRYSS
jgi:uroporphyrinogen decarboxylase